MASVASAEGGSVSRKLRGRALVSAQPTAVARQCPRAVCVRERQGAPRVYKGPLREKPPRHFRWAGVGWRAESRGVFFGFSRGRREDIRGIRAVVSTASVSLRFDHYRERIVRRPAETARRRGKEGTRRFDDPPARMTQTIVRKRPCAIDLALPAARVLPSWPYPAAVAVEAATATASFPAVKKCKSSSYV